MAVSRLEGRGIRSVAEEGWADPEAGLAFPRCQFPDPVPRIGLAWSTVTGRFRLPWVRCRGVEGLSPRDPRNITGGDSNPDRSSGVLAPFGSGWPRRWPPTPAVPAFGCFARPVCESRTPLREPFPISSFTFADFQLCSPPACTALSSFFRSAVRLCLSAPLVAFSSPPPGSTL